MARSSRRSLLLVVFFLLACGFLGILFAQRSGQQSSMAGDSEVKDSLKQFTDVYSIIEENYAEPVNAEIAAQQRGRADGHCELDRANASLRQGIPFRWFALFGKCAGYPPRPA